MSARNWFSSPAGRVCGVIALATVAICYWIFQVAPLLDDRGTGVAGLGSHQNDYKHVYLGSVILGEGLSPYNAETMLTMAGDYSNTVDPRFRTILPYVYLPFTGWVLRPLTMLPFPRSVVAFQLLNHACIIIGLWLLAWTAGWHRRPWLLALLLALAAFNQVVFRQNNAGQLNAVLFLGMCVLYACLERGAHDAAVGAVAAFLMLFKLSPGILLVWFLLRREWKRAAWMAGFATVYTAITVGVYGLDRHLEFLPVLRQMGYGKSTWAEFGNTFWRDPYNQSFNALFHRLFVEFPGSEITPWMKLSPAAANGMTWCLSIAILALFAVVSARAARQLAPAFALAVCASLLLPSILWDHYLTQLLLPLVVLLRAAMEPPRRALLLPLLGAAALIMAWPIVLDQPAFRSGAGLLLMSVKLVPVLLCFGISAALALRCGTSANDAAGCGAASSASTPPTTSA
jgi:hypothetical protein